MDRVSQRYYGWALTFSRPARTTGQLQGTTRCAASPPRLGEFRGPIKKISKIELDPVPASSCLEILPLPYEFIWICIATEEKSVLRGKDAGRALACHDMRFVTRIESAKFS